MDKDKQNISFSGDDKESFDLDGIIINPVGNQGDESASSSGTTDTDSTTGTHAVGDTELLEESGIEILREGKSISLDDPDLM